MGDPSGFGFMGVVSRKIVNEAEMKTEIKPFSNSATLMSALSIIPLPLKKRLELYAGLFGLAFGDPVDEDPEMVEILAEAMDLLPGKDRAYADSVPVFMVYGVSLNGGSFQDRAAKVFGSTDGSAILVYAKALREHSEARRRLGKKPYTRAEMVDWVYRILLHEIGHARDGRSDVEMAVESGY